MPATLLSSADASTFSDTAARTAALLREGQLVGLPTETVYGIALDLRHSAARQRLKQLKQITANPGWVIHLAQPEDAFDYVAHLSPLAERLIRKAWPGPVAIQVSVSPADREQLLKNFPDFAEELLVDGRITLRCPDLPITQQAIEQVKGPVAIIGATAADHSPAFDPQSIPPFVAEQLAAIVDAGPTRYRKASTLVRVTSDKSPESPAAPQHARDRVEVIRPGVIDGRIIHRMAEFVILFVCSGNTCRSPMAAGLAAKFLADKLAVPVNRLSDKNVHVVSAGLHAMRGMHATPEAVDAAAELNADIQDHVSQAISLELLHRADLIYTMTEAHREQIIDILPAAEKKTHRLDPHADVDDPVGGDADLYRQVAHRLAELINHQLSGIRL